MSPESTSAKRPAEQVVKDIRRATRRHYRLFEIVFCVTGRSGDAAGVGAFKVAMETIGPLSSSTMSLPVKALDNAAAVDRINAVGLTKLAA